MFQPCHFLHASSVCEVVDGTNYSVKNGSYAVTAWDLLSSPFRKKLTKRNVENNTGENIIFTPSKNIANSNESIEYSPYTFREKQFTRKRRNLHVRIHVHFNNQNDVQESEEVLPSHKARHQQRRPQRMKTINRRKPPKRHHKPTKHKVIKQHNEEEEPPELNNGYGYEDANDGRIEPQDYGDEQTVPDEEDTNPDDHEYGGDNENTDEGVSNIDDGKNEGPSSIENSYYNIYNKNELVLYHSILTLQLELHKVSLKPVHRFSVFHFEKVDLRFLKVYFRG